MAHEVRHAFVSGEHVQLYRLGMMHPCSVSRGDHDVARPARQERLQFLGILGVVEDQQPAANVAATQPLNSSSGCIQGVVAGLNAEPGGQTREGQADLLRPFRGDPPDQVVVAPATMRILKRNLGLADTAQPIQSLRQHDRRAAARQLPPKPVQDRAAAGEISIPGGHIPDPRDHSAKTILHRQPRGLRERPSRRSAAGQLAQRMEYLKLQAITRAKGADNQPSVFA